MTISYELLLTLLKPFNIVPNSLALERFDKYAQMLIDYNKKVNLTAITDPDGIVAKHFADSLCLAAFTDLSNNKSLCDVGTGAGFPGVALLIYNPALKVTMFDSVGKKLEFVTLVLNELGLTAEVKPLRAEDAAHMPQYRQSFDVVTARAVAKLSVLCECCLPLVKQGGVFAPMKAVMTEDEREDGIKAARLVGAESYNQHLYSLDSVGEREIVVFNKLSQSPTKYPRNYSQIIKKPL